MPLPGPPSKGERMKFLSLLFIGIALLVPVSSIAQGCMEGGSEEGVNVVGFIQPEFTWKILADLTNVSFLIDHEASSDPGVTPEGIIENVKLDPVADGEWYFHLKYQNQYGWGQPGHRKFMIDATPPEPFTVSINN